MLIFSVVSDDFRNPDIFYGGRDMEVGLKPSVLPQLCLMKEILVAIKKSKIA